MLLGACSVSNRSQSKPAGATISAAKALGRLHHSPICWRPSARARLKRLLEKLHAQASHEGDADGAERPVVGAGGRTRESNLPPAFLLQAGTLQGTGHSAPVSIQALI